MSLSQLIVRVKCTVFISVLWWQTPGDVLGEFYLAPAHRRTSIRIPWLSHITCSLFCSLTSFRWIYLTSPLMQTLLVSCRSISPTSFQHPCQALAKATNHEDHRYMAKATPSQWRFSVMTQRHLTINITTKTKMTMTKTASIGTILFELRAWRQIVWPIFYLLHDSNANVKHFFAADTPYGRWAQNCSDELVLHRT